MSQPKIIFSSSTLVDSSTSCQKIINLLLKNRHIPPSQFDRFLNPKHPKLLTPSRFGVSSSQLRKAVSRIRRAIKKKQNILIYGDYDADGITATAILWQVLHLKGAKVTPFIPHRKNDGYGLKFDSVQSFASQKNLIFDLIITVDNGIVAVKQIKKLIKQGTDVIITDHHVAPATLPPAVAIIHSTKTCGAGLSWLLSQQISPQSDLGLAAIGLVADCLPLTSINRNIVYHGLASLQENPSHGVKALSPPSPFKKQLSTYDLGFILAPQINAAGRLEDPTDALRLLCSPNPRQANIYATKLRHINQQRQLLQKQAIKLATKTPPSPTEKLIFKSHSQYHPGIIGLVAGFLSQNYYLPSVVISRQKNISAGSCRSIFQFDIIKALRRFSSLFVDLGGHPAAAGFSIKNKNIPILKKKLQSLAKKQLAKADLSPSLTVDATAKLSALKIKNIKAINRLQPFGMGNRRPLFYFKNLKIVSKKLVGADFSHLKLQVDDPDTPAVEKIPARPARPATAGADAIAFKKGHFDQKIKVGDCVDLVASLDINTWNGRSTPQLIVKEIFLST